MESRDNDRSSLCTYVLYYAATDPARLYNNVNIIIICFGHSSRNSKVETAVRYYILGTYRGICTRLMVTSQQRVVRKKCLWLSIWDEFKLRTRINSFKGVVTLLVRFIFLYTMYRYTGVRFLQAFSNQRLTVLSLAVTAVAAIVIDNRGRGPNNVFILPRELGPITWKPITVFSFFWPFFFSGSRPIAVAFSSSVLRVLFAVPRSFFSLLYPSVSFVRE